MQSNEKYFTQTTAVLGNYYLFEKREKKNAQERHAIRLKVTRGTDFAPRSGPWASEFWGPPSRLNLLKKKK